MTFGVIIFTQIGMVMNSRKGRGSIFQVKHFANRIISLGIVLEIVLFIILSYVPLFHTLFNTAPIGLDDWLYLLACPFVIMTLEEIRYRLSDIAYLIKSKSVVYLRLKKNFDLCLS